MVCRSFWVISRHFTEFDGCQLFPRKRTSAERVEMSVKGQQETLRASGTAAPNLTGI